MSVDHPDQSAAAAFVRTILMKRTLWKTITLPFASLSVGPVENIGRTAEYFEELPDYVAHLVDNETGRRGRLAFYVDDNTYDINYDREVAEGLINNAIHNLLWEDETQMGGLNANPDHGISYHNVDSVRREIHAAIFRSRYSSIQDSAGRGMNNFLLRFPRRVGGMITLESLEPYIKTKDKVNNVHYLTGKMWLYGKHYNFYVMHPYVNLKEMDSDALAEEFAVSLVKAFPFMQCDVMAKPEQTADTEVAYRLADNISFD